MPINYRNYHPMWKQISRFVRLIRAQNCCEECGIKNYTVQHYEEGTLFDREHFDTYREARDYATDKNKNYLCIYELTHRWAVVILTVAHLDHDVGNNDLDNLKALCQGCHLGHDRADNANRRRYGPKGRHHNQIRLEL